MKFLVTEDGSAYTGYGTLEGTELKVQIGGQSHPKLGTQWNPDVVLTLTVNADGTLTMPTWKDGSYNDLSNYVATKYVEDGDDAGEDLAVVHMAAGNMLAAIHLGILTIREIITAHRVVMSALRLVSAGAHTVDQNMIQFANERFCAGRAIAHFTAVQTDLAINHRAAAHMAPAIKIGILTA